MSVMRPDLIMKSIIPVVMAGILAIYGLVLSVLIAGNISAPPTYTLYKGFLHLGAGLAVGFCGLAAGFAIGIVGDAGVRGTAQQPRLFVVAVKMAAQKSGITSVARLCLSQPIKRDKESGKCSSSVPSTRVCLELVLLTRAIKHRQRALWTRSDRIWKGCKTCHQSNPYLATVLSPWISSGDLLPGTLRSDWGTSCELHWTLSL
uniref:V-type proton ATPase proteolipid subunit n=2 Tax=Timema TaxID=61471 RepID=A0A7R8ZDA7_TIMDO|nr:unnamed protein product [Timema douglasi]